MTHSLKLIILWLLAIGSHSFAATPLAKPSALHWPSAPRPNAIIKDEVRQDDGFRETFTLIDLGSVGVEIENKGKWQLANSNPRYSAILNRRETSNYQFAVSVFEPKEFLTSLDLDTWARYIEAVANRGPDTSIVFESNNIEDDAMPFVLGQSFRQVVYESPLPEGDTYKVRELFAIYKGKLLVFTFQGTKAEVDSRWKESDLMLTRMNPARDKK